MTEDFLPLIITDEPPEAISHEIGIRKHQVVDLTFVPDECLGSHGFRQTDDAP